MKTYSGLEVSIVVPGIGECLRFHSNCFIPVLTGLGAAYDPQPVLGKEKKLSCFCCDSYTSHPLRSLSLY